MATQRLTRWVALDDGDSSITYSGEWYTSDELFGGVRNTYGPPYLRSQHATTSEGGLAFRFQGSNVGLYGTSYQLTNTSLVQDPDWGCSVDGISYRTAMGFEDRPINQWLLCSIEDLDPSEEHLVTLDAEVIDATFYFDSVMYRPSYELRNSLHPTVYVFHSDSAIMYSESGWISHRGGEVRLTSKEGAKMKFAFNGTKATWFGQIPVGFPLENSTATYSVDEKEPVEFEIMGLPSQMKEALYYIPLFETPSLSKGEHTVEVVHKGPGAPLSLQYFLVEDGDIVQPEGLILEFNEEKGGKKAPTGAIVGGVVGGIVLLGIIAVVLYFYIRQRRRGVGLRASILHSHVEESSHPPTLPHLTPPPTAQVHSSTNLVGSPVSGTGMPYPAEFTRPVPGRRQSSAILSASQDTPYDLSLLGPSSAPLSSHQFPTHGLST